MYLLAVLVILSLPGALIAQIAEIIQTVLKIPLSYETSSLVPVDKLVHAVLFFGAGALLGRGWYDLRIVWLALLVSLLIFAGLTELIQFFVPGRSAAWGDFFADGLGGGIGLLLVRRIISF